MAKIEKVTRVQGYKFAVIDRFKTWHYFATYRDALAFVLL